jgi:hypothetical protein
MWNACELESKRESERERERVRMCVCVCEREREIVRVCACVCLKERERKRERERASVCDFHRLLPACGCLSAVTGGTREKKISLASFTEIFELETQAVKSGKNSPNFRRWERPRMKTRRRPTTGSSIG